MYSTGVGLVLKGFEDLKAMNAGEEISEKDSEMHKVGGGILGRLKELLTEFFEEDVT